MSAMPQLSAESALGVNSANYRSIGAWAQWHNWAQYQPWAQFRELSQYWRLSAMPQLSAVFAPERNAAIKRSIGAWAQCRELSQYGCLLLEQGVLLRNSGQFVEPLLQQYSRHSHPRSSSVWGELQGRVGYRDIVREYQLKASARSALQVWNPRRGFQCPYSGG